MLTFLRTVSLGRTVRLWRTTAVVLLILAFAGTPLLLAQGDPQPITAADGSFHFMAPAGWIVYTEGSLAMLGTSEAAMGALDSDTEVVPAGEAFSIVVGPALLDRKSVV